MNKFKSSKRMIIRVVLIFLCFGWLFLVSIINLKNDFIIGDEVYHLSSGYSYLALGDMRMNPTHPPLIKIVAAIPLLFNNLSFPSFSSWKDVSSDGQIGSKFLYNDQNLTRSIIREARFMMLMFTMALALTVFLFTCRYFGKNEGLLALFFLSFSPTILAHGHFITTDIGAALGFLLSLWVYIEYLESPVVGKMLLSSLVLGFALLAKYSLVILLPILFLVTIVWGIVNLSKLIWWLGLLRYFLVVILAGVVINFVNMVLMRNYPYSLELYHVQLILSSSGNTWLDFPIIFLLKYPFFRFFDQYLLGLKVITNRVFDNVPSYFFGQGNLKGSRWYFPFVYLIKEPLSLHLLSLLVFLQSFWIIHKLPFAGRNLLLLIKKYFIIFSILIAIIIYWLFSINAVLNIGIRHIMPVLPLIYILTAVGVVYFLNKNIVKLKAGLNYKTAVLLVGICLLWQVVSVVMQFPYYISYANEIIGGPKNLQKYVVNSDLDWDQDLLRLQDYVLKHKILSIYISSVGECPPGFFGPRALPWPTSISETYNMKGYVAVSVTNLMLSKSLGHPWLQQCPLNPDWFLAKQPVDYIGRSIAIYYFQ
jgi:hypothetical protein